VAERSRHRRGFHHRPHRFIRAAASRRPGPGACA
jgi:hypothetical protein